MNHSAVTDNETTDGKKPNSQTNVFTEVANILLSPTRYAILASGSLFHHDKSKPIPGVDGDNLNPKWNHKLPF